MVKFKCLLVLMICVVKMQTDKAVDLPSRCGRQLIDPTKRLSKGRPSIPGDWPWHVAIVLKETGTNVLFYYCGGTIISTTAVITAGHCVILNGVKMAADRFVVIGGTNNFDEIGRVGRQTLDVKEVILHPNHDNYNVSTSDVAILRVDKFEFTEYVQPICIWGPIYHGKVELFGQKGVVMGRLTYSNNTVSKDVIKAAYMMVYDDSTCLNLLPSEYGRLQNEFTLCAGGLNHVTNVRKGDSGSGLYMPVDELGSKETWFLRGVLSKCLTTKSTNYQDCDSSLYVVITDIAPQYSWIFHHSGLQDNTDHPQ